MRTRLLPTLIISALWLVIGTCILVLTGQTPRANAAAFSVTTVNDSGAGSLRQAIADANGNGNPGTQDTIQFAIAGDGSKRILLDSGLSITEPVVINGYTQGLATENTVAFPAPVNSLLRVELYFNQVGHIVVTSPDVTLRGLSFFSSEAAGASDRIISLNGADNFKIYGSHIGTDYSGMMGESSDTEAIDIVNSDGVRIGGVFPAERNIIGICNGECITASITSGNTTDDLRIQGNYIGVGSDGLTVFQNNSNAAIWLLAGVNNTLIGGTEAGAGNFISNQNRGAVYATDLSGLEVYGNYISLNGAVQFGSSSPAVQLSGVQDSVIGSTVSGGKNTISGTSGSGIQISNSIDTNDASDTILIEGNTFGYNLDENMPFRNVGDNIRVEDDSHDIRIRQNKIHNAEDYPSSTTRSGVRIMENAQNVSVLQNSIYHNSKLGIEIDNATTNDTLDADTGPNGILNFPGYTELFESSGNTEVTFTMDVPAGDYRVEFFTNTVAESGAPGEGETYVGSVNVTSNGAGLQEFFHTLTGTGLANLALTATEIEPSSPTGYGATSQFGRAGAAMERDYDIRVSQTILNLDEVALGNVLEYQVVITNDGPDRIDLSDYDASGPSSIFAQEVLAPQLEYAGVTGANIACTDLGAGSAGSQGTRYASHASYSVVNCGFTGPRTYLTAGQSFTFTIQAEVIDDSSLEFYSYVLAFVDEPDPEWSSYNAAVLNNLEFIYYFTASPIDNFAGTFSMNNDIEVTKTLNNPQDVAVGASLSYTIMYKNNGPGPSDLSRFDGSGMNPFLTSIFIGFVPPNLSTVVESNPDIACTDAGPGSASMAPYFVNHTGHGLLLCQYVGSAESLASGESISFTYSVTVNSEPVSFTSYVIAGATAGDPDFVSVGNTFDIGEDALDELATLDTNNFATAVYSQVVDISGEMTLLNPEDVAPGASLQYEIKFTNNGPDEIDPTYFDASGFNPIIRSLFLGIAPPNLSYVSQSNPDTSCNWAGPGSASLAPFFANHMTYSLLVCAYIGSDTSLLSGESISTTLTFTADTAPASFTNYVLAGSTSIDPDFADIQIAFNTIVDTVDYMTSGGVNNFAAATYPIPTPTPTPATSGGGSGSSAGGLAATGQAVLAFALLAAVLVGSGVLLVRRRRRG